MFVLEKFCKTAFENKEKNLCFGDRKKIPVIFLSKLCKLHCSWNFGMKVVTNASALPSEPLFTVGVGLREGWTRASEGVLRKGRQRVSPLFRDAQERGRSLGDSGVGGRSETDLHQKLRAVTFLFQTGKVPQQMPGDEMIWRGRRKWSMWRPSRPLVLHCSIPAIRKLHFCFIQTLSWWSEDKGSSGPSFFSWESVAKQNTQPYAKKASTIPSG